MRTIDYLGMDTIDTISDNHVHIVLAELMVIIYIFEKESLLIIEFHERYLKTPLHNYNSLYSLYSTLLI